MPQKKRFYVAKSGVYGITVYDRETQCPAFEYGANNGMEDIRATMLAVNLNLALRRGYLEKLHVTAMNAADA